DSNLRESAYQLRDELNELETAISSENVLYRLAQYERELGIIRQQLANIEKQGRILVLANNVSTQFQVPLQELLAYARYRDPQEPDLKQLEQSLTAFASHFDAISQLDQDLKSRLYAHRITIADALRT